MAYNINNNRKLEYSDNLSIYDERQHYVDVIANFNRMGKFRPVYVRLEDKDGLLRTYQVANILYDKQSKLSGYLRTIFCVNLDCSGITIQYELVYEHHNSQWLVRRM